ncbi:hypothetical protein [Candidatus Bathycorpusculum sp.]|uniref:hypothetical protein n=1 Tax=Candidatus Bathycorpusculum sp. TaxID=2994959 RepID=UPI00282CDFCB|nr:hypothetical protein [Candidatus Termitimicrobium sp.]
MIAEEQITSKITELMKTLDHIKKYNAIARSLKPFMLIIAGSIATFLALLTIFDIYGIEPSPNNPMFAAGFLASLIPLIGLACGILYIRKQVNAVKVGKWQPEISKGFASTLKLLGEMDWEKTLEDISMARFGYAIYSILKAGTCLVVSVAAFELAWNSLTLLFLHTTVPTGAFFWGFVAVSVVVFVLGKDFLRRYRELRALDMLVWELRWFSVEFEKVEFQA